MLLINRIGLIAASQLPGHYFLAAGHLQQAVLGLSSRTRASLMQWHKVSGRLIVFLLSIHAFLYCQLFLQKRSFWRVFRQPNITVALVSAGILLIMTATSIACVRQRHPKAFRNIHISGSATVPVLLFFHVARVRVFLWGVVFVYVVNTALRRLRRG